MKKINDLYTIKTEIELGLFLKKLREKRNLTLRQVAEKGDISSSYLNHLEIKNEKVGLPSPEYFNKLFEVYDLTQEEKKEFLSIYFNLILPKIFVKNLDNEKMNNVINILSEM